MQFDVTVDRNVIPDQSITNVATAEWTSLKDPDQITTNNPNAYPRTGLGPNGKGELNNYTTDDAATLTIKKPLVSKKLLYTSIDDTHNTNEQAVIGETATYEIVVTIPQGETPDAVLKDRFTDLQLRMSVAQHRPSAHLSMFKHQILHQRFHRNLRSGIW